MIYCANNNTLYRRAQDACNDLGISKSVMSRHLAGERKTAGSYVLTNVNTSDPAELQDVRRWLLYSTYNIIIDVGDPVMHGGDIDD